MSEIEADGIGETQTLEKTSKSKAELFGILASISTKLEDLNENDLLFVVHNIKQTFNPYPNFTTLYDLSICKKEDIQNVKDD